MNISHVIAGNYQLFNKLWLKTIAERFKFLMINAQNPIFIFSAPEGFERGLS